MSMRIIWVNLPIKCDDKLMKWLTHFILYTSLSVYVYKQVIDPFSTSYVVYIPIICFLGWNFVYATC